MPTSYLLFLLGQLSKDLQAGEGKGFAFQINAFSQFFCSDSAMATHWVQAKRSAAPYNPTLVQETQKQLYWLQRCYYNYHLGSWSGIEFTFKNIRYWQLSDYLLLNILNIKIIGKKGTLDTSVYVCLCLYICQFNHIKLTAWTIRLNLIDWMFTYYLFAPCTHLYICFIWV